MSSLISPLWIDEVDASMFTKKALMTKWSLYSAALLLFVLLQQVLHVLPDIWGVSPFIMPIIIAIVAALEGPVPGTIFGICVGMLCDLIGGGIFSGIYTISFYLYHFLFLHCPCHCYDFKGLGHAQCIRQPDLCPVFFSDSGCLSGAVSPAL